MAGRTGLIAFLGALTMVVSACSSGVTEPLSSTQLNKVVNTVGKPPAFTKLSIAGMEAFEEKYGDQERLDPTYENASDECAAVSDLDRVPRFAEGGNSYRKFMPTLLRDFDDIAGLEWLIETEEDSDVYAYATVRMALIAFADEESASDFSSTISDNVETCFDFQRDGDGILRALELSRFAYADDESGDFSLEFTDFIEIDLTVDFKLATDHIITVTHFGPNLLITHMSTGEDARAELGISLPDLIDGSGQLKELFEEAILSVQSVG